MRAARNQIDNDQSPEATTAVPSGALMRGVPYTMTFCGKYWLIDSYIPLASSDNSSFTDVFTEMIHIGSEADGTYLISAEREDGAPVLELGGRDDDARAILRGVETPKENSDAANKEYVDKVAGALGGQGAGYIDVTEEFNNSELDALDYMLNLTEGNYILYESYSKYYCEVIHVAQSNMTYHNMRFYNDDDTIDQTIFINGVICL